MKITLTKHGGWTAGMRRPPRSVDVTALPEATAQNLKNLVAAAQSAPTPEEVKPGATRDGMSYTITVEDAQAPTVLKQSDAAMSPEFAALMQHIERIA